MPLKTLPPFPELLAVPYLSAVNRPLNVAPFKHNPGPTDVTFPLNVVAGPNVRIPVPVS